MNMELAELKEKIQEEYGGREPSEENRWSVYIHIVPKEISGYDWDKYYVGITSVSVQKRWKNGFGYYENEHFFRTILKYGWKNILHEVIITNISKSDACDIEIYLINVLNSFNSMYGYNKTLGGEGTKGVSPSEELRKQQSERISGDKNPFYGKHHTEETRKLMSDNHFDCSYGNNGWATVVYQFDKNHQYIEKYDALKEAADKFGVDYHLLQNAQKRKSITQGFFWAYANDVIDDERGIRLKDPDRFVDKHGKRHTAIYQFDQDGVFIRKYDSIVEAANSVQAFSSNIIEAAKKKGDRILLGYRWRYAEDVVEDPENSGSFLIA